MRRGAGGEGLEVGFLCHGWFPDVGGVESHSYDLAYELRAHGHRVSVLCLDYSEGLEPYSVRASEVDGVEVHRMAYRYHDHRALADLVENPRASRVVLEWLGQHAFDVVHVHHLTGFGSGVLRAIRGTGLPLVMTMHDYWSICPRGQMVQPDGTVDETAEPVRCGACLASTWPHLMPSGSGELRGPAGEELETDADAARARTEYALGCLMETHRLFTPSEAAKAVYVRAGIPADHVEVVPNGIEVNELAAAVRRLRAVREGEDPTDEIRLGILGTLLPSKGSLELIRAFQEANVPGLTIEIHGNMPSYHGDTSYVDEVRHIASTDPRIRIHGPYRHDRLGEILSGLDGVAAPSRWCEVFGLTVREARAAGLPVLVSGAGDLGAVAAGGRAGIVVAVDDHAGWVEALRAFADYENRARWRRHTTKPRSAYDMMLQVERAYARVIERVTGRAPELPQPTGGRGGRRVGFRGGGPGHGGHGGRG